MTAYFEVFFIFILCTFLYPLTDISAISLIYILSALILACFTITIKQEQAVTALSVLSLIICMFQKEFVCFLPVLLYRACYQKKYIFGIAGIILAIYTGLPAIQEFLIVTFILSFYLSSQNRKQEDLKTIVKRLRDNSVEQEMYLKQQNKQLLAKQDDEIYIATLKERNRIAREIHDHVGHTLSRSILQIGALLTICKDEELKNHLEVLKASLDDAMNNIRESVHDLHDESVDLKSALQELVNDFTFCTIHFDCDVSRYVPKEIKYCFIAIVKEALNNITRHSNATQVLIAVKEHPGLYQLLIEDNGTKPFYVTDTKGIGLSNMKERADTLHGILHITSEQGVKIFLSIPK